jgi:hypothetical protein
MEITKIKDTKKAYELNSLIKKAPHHMRASTINKHGRQVVVTQDMIIELNEPIDDVVISTDDELINLHETALMGLPAPKASEIIDIDLSLLKSEMTNKTKININGKIYKTYYIRKALRLLDLKDGRVELELYKLNERRRLMRIANEKGAAVLINN